ncbi:MAG: hypothetical protein F6K19_35900 [Cyanothece sp. SIO1E1]|nr:hypothetical protein [Cyanothece sp. SIO1E1]
MNSLMSPLHHWKKRSRGNKTLKSIRWKVIWASNKAAQMPIRSAGSGGEQSL